MSTIIPMSAHPCDTPLLAHARDPHRDGWTLCTLPAAGSLGREATAERPSCPVCLDRLHSMPVHLLDEQQPAGSPGADADRQELDA